MPDDLYDSPRQGSCWNGRYDGDVMGKQGTRQEGPVVDVDYLGQCTGATGANRTRRAGNA